MLTCNRCQTEKPLDAFYASQRSYCRDCWKVIVKENRRKNPEKYRAYDKSRNSDAKRVASRAAYAQTEKGKAVAYAAKKKWAESNADKRAAHVILGNAVRDQRIIKPDQCQRCQCSVPSRRLHAHHADYAYPLQVEWICSVCHGKEHHD